MRHDYDLPAEWDAMTPAEKHDWMLLDRVRRQSERQRNVSTERAKALEAQQARRNSRRAEIIDVVKHR